MSIYREKKRKNFWIARRTKTEKLLKSFVEEIVLCSYIQGREEREIKSHLTEDATLVQISLITPYHLLQSKIPFQNMRSFVYKCPSNATRLESIVQVFVPSLRSASGQFILWAVWCLLTAWLRMVNWDYNEFPRNSVQSRKNSPQKCSQANKRVLMTRHCLCAYTSSIFVAKNACWQY